MNGYSYLNEKEQVFTRERRVNKRYRYNDEFKIESINLEHVNLEVKGIDISISGIGFIFNKHLKINDMLGIAFKYNNVTIPVTVKIQHVNLYDSGFFVGGQFVAMQDSYREILKDLI